MKIKRVFLKGSISCVLTLLLVLLSTIALGATFCVSNETELQSALITANSNGEDNTIKIVQSTYNGNFIYCSTEAYGLTLEGGYTQACAPRTIDPANTILDGGGTDMVLALVSQKATNFSVEGLTLRNGNTSTVDKGGGLYVRTQSGNITLTNNTFTGNTANGDGGGVSVNSSKDIILTNNTISANVAETEGGGHIPFYLFQLTPTENLPKNDALDYVK